MFLVRKGGCNMRRYLRLMFVAIGVLGFFLLLGTAGAETIHNMSILQATVQSLFGLALLLLGYGGARRCARRPVQADRPHLRVLKGGKRVA